MNKLLRVLLLLLLLSLLLSACDLLGPSVDDDFYFGGDIPTGGDGPAEPGDTPDMGNEGGIGDNHPTDLPYLPLA